MRCPKCNYISFDQEEICKNCSRPIPLVEELTGTAIKAENYTFLSSILGVERVQSKAEEPEVDVGEMFPEEAEVELEMDEELEEDELEVPNVDISQFEEGSDEEFEEELEGVMDEAVGEVEEEDGLELAMDGGDEDDADQEPETPLPEPDVKLDIDVDLDDEPADDEIVFNLEDIDESDLIIDESEEDEEKDKEKIDSTIELPDIDL